jgi:hypothetical protein
LIRIQPSALEFIRKKGGQAYLEFMQPTGGCCDLPLPILHPGAPKNPNGYEAHQVEGVTIHLPDRVQAKDEGIEVCLQGFSIFAELKIKGIRLV